MQPDLLQIILIPTPLLAPSFLLNRAANNLFKSIFDISRDSRTVRKIQTEK